MTIIGSGAEKLMEFHAETQNHQSLEIASPAEVSVSLQGVKCLKGGCNLKIIGDDASRLMDYHDMSERISFEKTGLGKMPPEIMLIIIHYCNSRCMRNYPEKWTIMMLGSVCRKLNELIKNEGWYREIKLSWWHRPSLESAAFEEVITRSAAHLQTIRCGTETKEWLFYALKKRDNAIEEIYFEYENDQCGRVMEELHDRSNELNLRSLTKLCFTSRKVQIDWRLKKGIGTEHFSSRINTLAVTFCREVREDIHRRIGHIDYNFMTLTTRAIREIPSLNQVIVSFLATPRLHMDMEENIKRFKASMIALNLNQPLEKIGWNVERCNIKHSEGLLEFVLKRDEPELQFKKFLYGPS